jgi:parallel beta-helix repeat protein
MWFHRFRPRGQHQHALPITVERLARRRSRARRSVSRPLHVERMEERTLLSTFLVTTTSDNGDNTNPTAGSLRAAIIAANADSDPGTDTIDFDIPGSGVQTIQPPSGFPFITHPVIIDGYSQPGSSPNTLAVGDNAVLLIQISGSNACLPFTSSSNTVRGLVINGGTAGIYLLSDANNVVQGNFIGTGPTGEKPLGNAGGGVQMNGSSGNLIGTNGDGVNDYAERNILSSNGPTNGSVANVLIGGSNNIVAGNYIGTDANGTAPLGGASYGVLVDGNGNRVGVDGHDADPATERNVISGNQAGGVSVNSNGTLFTQNVIAGNFIGTDVTGTKALPNGTPTAPASGVTISGDDNRVGTDGDGVGDAYERNIISGNYGDGISILYSNNIVAGNYVDTDVTGTKALGNTGSGVYLGYTGTGNRIGTDGQSADNAGERNIISGNLGEFAIYISQTQGGHLIAGNLIGVAADGKTPLGNGGYGIGDDDSNIQIGGSPVLANTIANYVVSGVVVFSGTGVSIRANSIYARDTGPGILGIDLGNDGVTLNGSHTGQAGPNNWQTFPVLSAAFAGSQTEVTGTLSSTANTIFTIDFYADDSVDLGSGAYGQGHYYLGYTTVSTDASGNASFDVSNLAASAVGQWISATATDPAGDTSEFSLDVQAVKAASTTSLTASADTPLLGQPVTFTAVVTGDSGAPTGNVDFFDATTNTDLGSVLLSSHDGVGVAALTNSSLALSDHKIVATYTGDATYLSSSASTNINVLPPASLSGLVYDDLNSNAQVDFGELGIPGVPISLTGTDDLGDTVNLSQTTDADGTYVFLNLRPGTYTITETQQPAGYTQGIDTVGTAGGTLSGTQFAVSLPAGVDGLNYNYGERPNSTGSAQSGQTATIGFWNNKNGQALIKALNGGVGTNLGDWLAASFPHMFGSDSGSNDLADQSNASIAAFFQQKFVVHGQKLDAQVLATALAVYVTDPTLDTTGVGAQYGFIVGGNGLATATYNVGSNGAAFGVADNTVMTVMDILLAADAQAVNGVLYNGDTTKRDMANNVFSGINQAGDI